MRRSCQGALFEQRGGIFSPDRIHRYTLFRVWGDAAPLVVIGLNPSTADELADDPTIRRCIGFAKREACGGLVMLNLFAFRSTDPEGLFLTFDPIGAENDRHLREVCAGARRVVAAWGSHKKLGALLTTRARSVTVALREAGVDLHCFGTNADGMPKHPLYLAGETPIRPLTASALGF